MVIKSSEVAPHVCITEEMLLDLCTDAQAAFHKAQEPVLTGVAQDHPKYHEVRELREHAYTAMLKARRLYWEHVQEHGCQAHNTGGGEVN